MLGLFGLAIQIGLLWFFITYFMRATDPQASGRSAIIVIAIVGAANLLMAFTIRLWIGGFTTIISLVVLYFAVAWICETNRRTTLWIIGSYVVASIVIEIGIRLAFTPI